MEQVYGDSADAPDQTPDSYARQMLHLLDIQERHTRTLRDMGTILTALGNLPLRHSDELFAGIRPRPVVYRRTNWREPDLPKSIDAGICFIVQEHGADAESHEMDIYAPVAKAYAGLVFPYVHDGENESVYSDAEAQTVYEMAEELWNLRTDGILPDLAANGTTIHDKLRPDRPPQDL